MEHVMRDGKVRYHLVTFADGLPFDALPEYTDGGPSMVTVGGWCTSTTSGSHIDGVILGAHKPAEFSRDGQKVEHPLHGAAFPNRTAARRAAYEAGLIQFMIYDGTEHWELAKALMAPEQVDEGVRVIDFTEGA